MNQTFLSESKRFPNPAWIDPKTCVLRKGKSNFNTMGSASLMHSPPLPTQPGNINIPFSCNPFFFIHCVLLRPTLLYFLCFVSLQLVNEATCLVPLFYWMVVCLFPLHGICVCVWFWMNNWRIIVDFCLFFFEFSDTHFCFPVIFVLKIRFLGFDVVLA